MPVLGNRCFDDAKLKKYVSEEVYQEFHEMMLNYCAISEKIGEAVAFGMKQWAKELGVTHYAHWFQPMTGVTAEKHTLLMKDEFGEILFGYQELAKSEADASSFPSGKMRSTSQARGYTVWDPTTYPFIKDDILYIPAIFYSYDGFCLDKKMPLLQSIQVLNQEAMRVLQLFQVPVKQVLPMVGLEQEYFLIDEAYYQKRRDLKLCGRTLFGNAVIKGQQLEDHYLGKMDTRVQLFMKQVDCELYELGIVAECEHKEVAPNQFEIVTKYTEVNKACDYNQLVMETLQKVALEHGMKCLLHEKPFAGINGSGKHNNWSLQTDSGISLLSFQDHRLPVICAEVFLVAMIKGIDEYGDLIRLACASYSNDMRLGGNEAPPAVITVSLGKKLERMLGNDEIDTIENQCINFGVSPSICVDTNDRNRTSPIAFTGHKFEFRMLGSSASASILNTMIQTILAKELREYANIMEMVEDVEVETKKWLQEMYQKHKRVVYSEDGYAEVFQQMIQERGLLPYVNALEEYQNYTQLKNIQLFEEMGVLQEVELKARQEILIEKYRKSVMIEAKVLLQMVQRELLPSVWKYCEVIKGNVVAQMSVDALLQDTKQLLHECHLLQKTFEQEKIEDMIRIGKEMRVLINQIERMMAKEDWPLPIYDDMLWM